MIEEAIKIAKRSRSGKYQMGCVIARDGIILSNGWAHIPVQRNWKLYSMHAEMHALVRGRRSTLEGATAFIAAVSKKSGMYTIARPCYDCVIALRAAGIMEVAYTTDVWNDLGDIFVNWESLEGRLKDFKVYNRRPKVTYYSD